MQSEKRMKELKARFIIYYLCIGFLLNTCKVHSHLLPITIVFHVFLRTVFCLKYSIYMHDEVVYLFPYKTPCYVLIFLSKHFTIVRLLLSKYLTISFKIV